MSQPVRSDATGEVLFKSDAAITRKLHLRLNQITTEDFKTIANKIVRLVKQARKDEEVRLVARLILDHAKGDVKWSELYARLCCKVMGKINRRRLKGQSTLDRNTASSGSLTAGQLFRQYLVKFCEGDLVSEWATCGGKVFEEKGASFGHHQDQAGGNFCLKETGVAPWHSGTDGAGRRYVRTYQVTDEQRG